MLHGTCQGKKLSINILIVDNLKHNLISVAQLVNKENKLIFQKETVKIVGKNYEFVCARTNNLFVLNIDMEGETDYCHKIGDVNDLWHRRLGRPSKSTWT